MAAGDLKRSTSGVVLPAQVSSEIWASTQEASAVMAASRQIALPGSGITIPLITGDSAAGWVAESAEKPVSHATVSSKSMTPYKLAVIETFSMEFRRDLPGLYAELARRLPNALAKKFDETVLAGTAPGSNFDVLSSAPALTVDGTGTYADLVAVYSAIAAAGGDLSAWLASPAFQATLLSSVDGFGRPLFTNSPNTDNVVGQLLGRPVYGTRRALKASTTVGDDVAVAGDFANSAIYGTVEGIQVDVTDQATVNDGGTQINLWQRNMFAVRAEIEVGFITRDVNHFVRITDGVVDTP
ncbi:phage major capsid protein [Nocardioides sp. URHA0032]|uniref:phage major capsid protein n=1 Tax=Nocardioides sp. URHA0032 TaxID=1380388 RepID=UPI0009DED059|nr:phage major capsid protein [Nocardioides sp. URHA0032]